MIRAVFFDLGGVLLRTEDRSGRQKWERRLGLADWGLAETVFNSEASRRASLGQSDTDVVWTHIARRFGLTDAELVELRKDFWSGDRFDEALVSYVASLRPRCRTGIISNAWPDARAFLRRHPFVQAAFEIIIISAEAGVAKPDPRIYQSALRAFGLAPGEAILVDDTLENVEAARALGMVGVHYRPGLDVPAEFEKLGVK